MTSTFVPYRYRYRYRTDGLLRIRVTVAHPLRADDIALLASAHREMVPDELPLLRYTDAVHIIRTELIERGGKTPLLVHCHRGHGQRHSRRRTGDVGP
ncbi:MULTISPECIES: hypothetical protein [unclassified Streptomyces]|uniref:hypothetical protein n=1 Tax=unclassified Streptomyces TaxID=2593676 RepID=UPI002258A0DE|nr:MULTISPECIES: hypothetical protein [unclassified Streptomyces]MCX4405883.1 hypothetical protein [Streptomyces sp. NBC_01764]MCX5189594.1 hypothetical protein [Streptomyces sp. NBC_00268]